MSTFFLDLKFKKALLFFLGFFCFGILFSQEIPEDLDELKLLYNSKKYPKAQELDILKGLAIEENDPIEKLKFSEELLSLAKQLDSVRYIYSGYLQKGQALRIKGDFTQALECFFKGIELEYKDPKEKEENVAIMNTVIADVYSLMGNHENSIQYHKEAIQKFRNLKVDSLRLASALLNAGDALFLASRYDEAMTFFYESNLISNKKNYPTVSAYNLGNIGMVYAKQGKHSLAKANIDEAINILENLEVYSPISIYLEYIADIYIEQKQPQLARDYVLESLEISKKYQLKEPISTATFKLAQIYEALDDPKEALKYLNEHLVYKDSIMNIEAVQKMANLQTEFEVEKKQTELDLIEKEQKLNRILIIAVVIGLFLTGLLAFGLYRRNIFINKTSKIIEEERQKSEDLLHNILPEEAAEELKHKGNVTSKKFDSVTVLFTDFKGFTRVSETLSPERLVESIDFYFSNFDEILEKYNLEKIKTIGDAYMVAGGLPTPTEDHPKMVAKAALEIRDFVKQAKKKHAVHQARFDIRIGIHTGPVVAGVVGKNKFAYDIWGDTVNIAARMETASEAGKVNVSESTYQFIKDEFEFESRGSIDIKNRSAVNMYYLKGKID